MRCLFDKQGRTRVFARGVRLYIEGGNLRRTPIIGENHLFPGKFSAFAVLRANTQPAPIITAHLAEIAILARMLLGAFLLVFRNINFSRYAGQFNKWHGRLL